MAEAQPTITFQVNVQLSPDLVAEADRVVVSDPDFIRRTIEYALMRRSVIRRTRHPVDSGGLPCPDCGSPLRPCKCVRDSANPRSGSTLRSRKGMPKPKGPREKRSKHGTRFGPLFRWVKAQPCWLAQAEDKAGVPTDERHACGTLGETGGHTAHHVDRYDGLGLVPGCGEAHDRYHGLGSRKQLATFQAVLTRLNTTLKRVGLRYLVRAKEEGVRG